MFKRKSVRGRFLRLREQNILITGAEGMMGRYLTKALGSSAKAMGHKDLDIGDADRFRCIVKKQSVTAIINAAGLSTGTRREVFDTNAFYPAALGRVCRELDLCFVFLSSSRVFGGYGAVPHGEDALPNPFDDYGLSKYLGEKLVEQELYRQKHYIVRLPMVLGFRGGHPENQILTRLIETGRKGGVVRVASDVLHSPVHAINASAAIRSLLENNHPSGKYHITSGEPASLFKIVKTAVNEIGLEFEVLPVAAKWFGTERVPLNLALGSTRIAQKNDWVDAVRSFAEEYKKDLNARAGGS